MPDVHFATDAELKTRRAFESLYCASARKILDRADPATPPNAARLPPRSSAITRSDLSGWREPPSAARAHADRSMCDIIR